MFVSFRLNRVLCADMTLHALIKLYKMADRASKIVSNELKLARSLFLFCKCNMCIFEEFNYYEIREVHCDVNLE